MDNLINIQFEIIKEQTKLIDSLYAKMLRGGIYKITDENGTDISLEQAAKFEARSEKE